MLTNYYLTNKDWNYRKRGTNITCYNKFRFVSKIKKRSFLDNFHTLIQGKIKVQYSVCSYFGS